MKFTPIAVLALFTLTANAQIHGSIIPYDDVNKFVGSNQVFTSSLENEDVNLFFRCGLATGLSLDVTLKMVVDLGDEWINPQTYYPLSWVRITNDPSWVRISTSKNHSSGVSIPWLVMDTEWNGNSIHLSLNSALTYAAARRSNVREFMLDMILTEKPVYVRISTPNNIPTKYRNEYQIWYQYTFPIKGVGKALATIPSCRDLMEEL